MIIARPSSAVSTSPAAKRPVRSGSRIQLEPRASDLEYTQIYIGLDDGSVRAMELQDQFGQSTQIVFENLRVGVVHNPAIFKFVPPKGVDVYGVGG